MKQIVKVVCLVIYVVYTSLEIVIPFPAYGSMGTFSLLCVFYSRRDRDSDSEDCYILAVLLWPPCVADADIIFCPVVSFFRLSIVLFFFT